MASGRVKTLSGKTISNLIRCTIVFLCRAELYKNKEVSFGESCGEDNTCSKLPLSLMSFSNTPHMSICYSHIFLETNLSFFFCDKPTSSKCDGIKSDDYSENIFRRMTQIGVFMLVLECICWHRARGISEL